MKKIVLLLSVTVIIAVVSNHVLALKNRETISVLFIGNSLTSINNLPGMVHDIAASNGHSLKYASYTPGGSRLAAHAANDKVLEKINTGSWDFVVLQEQSQYPGFSKKQLAKSVFPHAKRLCDMVTQSNKETDVVFYMTMAHQDGDPDNKHVSRELLTYGGAQKRINRTYVEMGKRNHGLIAPVGEVWSVVHRELPKLELYRDNVHPNITGTYLAACVFYATLFNKKASGSVIPKGIDEESAQYIQWVVDKLVFNQHDKWDFRNSI